MGKWWRISKIQNHGGSFWPNDGKEWKTTLIFAFFSLNLKILQLSFYQYIETFFCALANAGLTDFSQIFFGDSQNNPSSQFFNM